MKCMACRSDEMVETKTSYFVKTKDCYVIIENVPCKKCVQCGEEVFSASVMERIDEIVERVSGLATKVCVMEYKHAA